MQIFKILIVAILLIPTLTFSQTNKNYIVIRYTSICCGTPTENPIMDYILKFEKNKKLKPFEMFVEYGLGKEGEHAYYVGTDNLNHKLTKSFLIGLKNTATKQNKQRSENSDGYVNVENEFMTNSTLKSIRDKPRTKISSLEVYDLKNKRY